MNLQLTLRQHLGPLELNVDVRLRRQSTGVFGASGAGKSSLLRAIAGLKPRASGRIVLNGAVWMDTTTRTWCPTEQRNIGYVPQEGLLFPNRSVQQNILSGARRARRSGQDPAQLLKDAVAVLELEDLLHRRVRALSGGERQRVALARALCSGPELLLLDEPLASLDRRLRWRILPLLRQAHRRFSLPMLLVSHDKTEIQALCDEVLVLEAGRVVRTGSPAAVFSAQQGPHHGSYRNIFVATPTPEGLQVSPALQVPPLSPDGHTRPTLVGIDARDVHLGEGPLTGTVCDITARSVCVDAGPALPVLVAEAPGDRWRVGQAVSLRMDPARWILMDR